MLKELQGRAALGAIGVIVAAALATPVATAAPSQASWQRPVSVEKPLGSPTTLTCPTEAFCAVGDGHGAIITGAGSDWRASYPDRGHAVVALSCSSATFCAAFDDRGYGMTYDGSKWTKPADLTAYGSSGTVDVSCPQADFCLAIAGKAKQALSFDGGGWTAQGKIPGASEALSTVSCATATFCAVGDAGGRVLTWNGSTWSAWHSLPDSSRRATFVSCPSDQVCEAVAGEWSARFESGTWTDTQVTDRNGSRGLLTCPTTTFCMTLGWAKKAFVLVDGAWKQVRTKEETDDALDLTCTSEKNCLWLDTIGYVLTWNGTRWVAADAVDLDTDPFSDLSCPEQGFCSLVDGHGWVEMLLHGSWQAPRRVVGMTLTPHLTCASSSLCFLVNGLDPNHAKWNGTDWRNTKLPIHQSPAAVSCSPQGTCLATAYNEAYWYDGSSWTAIDSPVTNKYPWAVSCASSSFCAASFDNDGGLVYTYDGSAWSAGLQVPGATVVRHLSCGASTLCLAILQDGTVSRFDGSAWSDPMSVLDHGTVSVSCPTAGFCAAINSSGDEVEYDGASWSQPMNVDPKGSTDLISCASSDFCVITDTKGYAVSKS